MESSFTQAWKYFSTQNDIQTNSELLLSIIIVRIITEKCRRGTRFKTICNKLRRHIALNSRLNEFNKQKQNK